MENRTNTISGLAQEAKDSTHVSQASENPLDVLSSNNRSDENQTVGTTVVESLQEKERSSNLPGDFLNLKQFTSKRRKDSALSQNVTTATNNNDITEHTQGRVAFKVSTVAEAPQVVDTDGVHGPTKGPPKNGRQKPSVILWLIYC